MDIVEFRRRGHELVDWIADYYGDIEKYPVRAQVKPGEILAQLPLEPPLQGEPFEALFQDFVNIILPGMTHWQHPGFCAYFNANGSFPSLLAEMLTSALGAQCMSWATSPAATELEERVMEWTRRLLHLPEQFTGVIQDTASTATLCAILSAREKISQFRINRDGFAGLPRFTVYCSTEAHSSIEKDVKILGLGKENLRKIDTDEHFAMKPELLAEAIAADRRAGYVPLAVAAAFGTTGSTAIDPLDAIGKICHHEGIWLHVDAAYAGSALAAPEIRPLLAGIEYADSFVFNPHKWMFTHFDCCGYFVRDVAQLVRSLEILPEYLKTKEGERVNNYRDWGIQLGRRFRALKLWFVLRSFGVEGLRAKIREHLLWAKELAEDIRNSGNFELMAPVPFSTVCFRFRPSGINDMEHINGINARLMETINDTGKLYLSHTKLKGHYTIRFVIGQTSQTQQHVRDAWRLIQNTAENVSLA